MAKNYQADVEAQTKDLDFAANEYQLTLKTDAGDIRITMLPDLAPGHVKNILGLARAGFYNGIIFHRVIDGFMIQAGCPNGTGTGGPGYQIKQEFNATPHVLGTMSMARTNDPNSAGSQFFLCLDRVPHLDKQYTVFGQAADTESEQVISKIGKSPTGAGDRPRQPTKIVSADVTAKPKS